MIEFVVTLWSAINRKVPRTPSSLLSHQGLSLSLRGSEGSEPGPGSCVKGWGVSSTPAMGLEAPFQETRLMAGWRILATTCALLLRGYNVQNKGCFGARVLEAWPRTFITLKPEQCVVFRNEPQVSGCEISLLNGTQSVSLMMWDLLHCEERELGLADLASHWPPWGSVWSLLDLWRENRNTFWVRAIHLRRLIDTHLKITFPRHLGYIC